VHIVLVYSGKRLPEHHLANVRLLSKTFPAKDVITVVDHREAQNQLRKRNFSSYLVNYEIEAFNKLKDRLSHNEKALNGFWYKTIKRFYMLREFMKSESVFPVLHIESDVILFPNFPFERLSAFAADLAYPFVTESSAAASIFFVRSVKALEGFLTFAESDSLVNTDTDMTLLARYAENHSVTILPTLVPDQAAESKLFPFGLEQSGFGGIFDAATYGQFLFGLDPRNNFGLRKVFSRPTSHLASPQELTFWFSKNDKSLNVTTSSGSTLPLFNLHIHSKDLRAFSESFDDANFLRKRCDSNMIKSRFELDLKALVLFAPSHFKGFLFLLNRLILINIFNRK